MSGVLYCDDSVVKGSKFVSKLFVMPGPANNNMVWAPEVCHKHEFSELLYFTGSGASPENIKDNRDLGGEIEIWIGDEKHIITESSYVFIPKGLMHGPIIYRRVSKPILEIRFADTPEYTRDMIEGLSIEGKDGVDRAKSRYGVLIYDNVKDRDEYIYKQMGGDETLATNYMIPDTVRECLYSDATTFLPNPPKDDGIVFALDSPHEHVKGMEYFLLIGLNPDEPENMGAKADMTANGKTYKKLTKSNIIHIPVGTNHCPLNYTEITAPTLFWPCGDNSMSEWDFDPMTQRD